MQYEMKNIILPNCIKTIAYQSKYLNNSMTGNAYIRPTISIILSGRQKKKCLKQAKEHHYWEIKGLERVNENRSTDASLYTENPGI